MLGKDKLHTDLYCKFIETGEDKYINQLYNSIYPYSINMTRKYIKKKYLAEDMVQDAFTQLYIKSHQFDTSQTFNRWYLVILFNFINATNQKEIRFESYYDYSDEKFSSIFSTIEGQKRLLYRWKLDSYGGDPWELESETVKMETYISDFLKCYFKHLPEEGRSLVYERFLLSKMPRSMSKRDKAKYRKAKYNAISSKSAVRRAFLVKFYNHIKFIEKETGIRWKIDIEKSNKDVEMVKKLKMSPYEKLVNMINTLGISKVALKYRVSEEIVKIWLFKYEK